MTFEKSRYSTVPTVRTRLEGDGHNQKGSQRGNLVRGPMTGTSQPHSQSWENALKWLQDATVLVKGENTTEYTTL